MSDDPIEPWRYNRDVGPEGEPLFLDRKELLLPYQVFSCWNGMVMMRTEPMYLEGVRIRAKTDMNSYECDGSESYLVCKDYWARGHRKIIVLPMVPTAYKLADYNRAQNLIWTRHDLIVGDSRAGPARKEREIISEWITTHPNRVWCVDFDHRLGHADALWCAPREMTPEMEGLTDFEDEHRSIDSRKIAAFAATVKAMEEL
jgi:hypothetical protein